MESDTGRRATYKLVRLEAGAVGLEVVKQTRLRWSLIRRGKYLGPAVHDCMTTLRKPEDPRLLKAA